MPPWMFLLSMVQFATANSLLQLVQNAIGYTPTRVSHVYCLVHSCASVFSCLTLTWCRKNIVKTMRIYAFWHNELLAITFEDHRFSKTLNRIKILCLIAIFFSVFPLKMWYLACSYFPFNLNFKEVFILVFLYSVFFKIWSHPAVVSISPLWALIWSRP